MAHIVYLALGSNLGNRLAYLQIAINYLSKHVVFIKASSIYETLPWGYTDQGKFLNMVVLGETDLSPLKLLRKIKNIEEDVGRNPTFKNGPREIDIDILLYDQENINEKGLLIPHPGIAERIFVIKPLAEINADGIEANSGKSFSALLSELDNSQIERKAELEINLEAIENRK